MSDMFLLFLENNCIIFIQMCVRRIFGKFRLITFAESETTNQI